MKVSVGSRVVLTPVPTHLPPPTDKTLDPDPWPPSSRRRPRPTDPGPRTSRPDTLTNPGHLPTLVRSPCKVRGRLITNRDPKEDLGGIRVGRSLVVPRQVFAGEGNFSTPPRKTRSHGFGTVVLSQGLPRDPFHLERSVVDRQQKESTTPPVFTGEKHVESGISVDDG